jgi:hypothetical protein
MKHRPEHDFGSATRERLGHQGNERIRSLGAARVCAAKAPSGADQLNLSLHSYIRFTEMRRPGIERQASCSCLIVT